MESYAIKAGASIIDRLFTGGPQDIVIAILLLVIAGFCVFSFRVSKEREKLALRNEELQRFAMSKVLESNKELGSVIIEMTDKHVSSQEKVTAALSNVNDSVKQIINDLELRISRKYDFRDRHD